MYKRQRPILLLDDLFDKLDASRLEALITLVGDGSFGQTVISDCNHTRLTSILDNCGARYTLFTVEAVSYTHLIETAEAQHTVTGDRRQVVITNPDGERVVDIRQPADGRIVVRVASVEIVMNDNGRERTAGAPVPPKRRAAAFGDSDSVSYTHLDVYKRQPPTRRGTGASEDA